jgi:response regulator of citrate/malate metabolism
MLQDTYNEILKELKSKYKKQTLTIQEVAKEMSISTGSLRNGMKKGINVPNYKEVGHGEQRKKVIFPIHEVAKYLANLVQVF